MLNFRNKNIFNKNISSERGSRNVKVFIVYVNLNNSSVYSRQYEYIFFKYRRTSPFMCKGLVLFKGRYFLKYVVNEEDQIHKYYRQGYFSPSELFNLYRGSFYSLKIVKSLDVIDSLLKFLSFFSLIFFLIKNNYNDFIYKYINIDLWFLLFLDLIISNGNIIAEMFYKNFIKRSSFIEFLWLIILNFKNFFKFVIYLIIKNFLNMIRFLLNVFSFFLEKIIILFLFIIKKGLLKKSKNFRENTFQQKNFLKIKIKNFLNNCLKFFLFSNVLWIFCRIIILSSEIYINFIKPLCIFIFEIIF